MDFFEENEIPEKNVIMLDYILNHYKEKNFWCFEIALPEEYSFLFEDSENNNIGKIFSRPRKVFIETLQNYFVLDNLSKEGTEAFDNLNTFYFRFHLNKIEKENPNIINTLAVNPLLQ